MNNKNSEGYADLTATKAIVAITREEKAAVRYSTFPLVYVCSPYRDDTQSNAERAKGYCRFVINQNAVPFAPHLLYPQFLDDSDRDERDIGLRCGTAILKRCDQLWVFGDRVSKGMAGEIAAAKKRGLPIRYFNSRCQEVDGC